jgi:hypothetical protein
MLMMPDSAALHLSSIIALSKDATECLAKGELVSVRENPGYLITAPRFMRDSPKYGWLNHVQAVGKI